MIDWKRIAAPPQEPVIVTSEHFPGWFDIGAPVLGEWRRGQFVAGNLMEHEPTHYAQLNPVVRRKVQ